MVDSVAVIKSKTMEFLDDLIGEPMTFGDTIKNIRECEELSQAVFAEKLGISKQHLSNVEHGRKAVSPERAAAWATMLGYNPKQFVRLALQDLLDRADLPFQVTVEGKGKMAA